MTFDDVLIELIEEIGTTGHSLVVGHERVLHWPTGALDQLLSSGLLRPTSPAESIECRGCDKYCYQEIQIPPPTDGGPARAFVVCDDPEMQEQMGRITIDTKQLQQWRITHLQIAQVIAKLLAIESKAEDRVGQANIRIGMVKGKGGRRWLSLNRKPLTLEVNDNRVALDELLYFDGELLAIDKRRIMDLVNQSPSKSGKSYQPSTERLEARRRTTEAMYEDWRQEYRKLRRHYPDTVRHTDSWIARKIAKMDIAKDRDWDTIRKHMKS